MSPRFQTLMLEATWLTRSGSLAAAQSAIQAALRTADTPVQHVVPPQSSQCEHPHPLRQAAGGAPKTTTIDILARIVGAPEQLPGRNGCSPPPPADGMTAGRHSAVGLHCDYQLFVPAGATGRARPLVVMLHGCTQNPADFASGTRMNALAQAEDFMVLYPAQSKRMNPQGCWNWFKHTHQRRGQGEPELLASLTRHVVRMHNADPARVYVAGLSAGGAMASVLGRCYPELYAAIGVHSGLAAGSASDLPSALAAMRDGGASAPAAADGKPVIVFHGDADATVHPANAARVAAASTAAPPVTETIAPRSSGERAATRSIHYAPDGRVVVERWTVHGAGHAWSGGSTRGSYTDPRGPDASSAMWRFFERHVQGPAER